MQKNPLWMVPKIILLYLIFTVVLYIVGPYNWPEQNLSLLIIYLLFALFFIFSGFYLSISHSFKQITFKKKRTDRIPLIKFFIVINLIFQIWGIVAYTNLEVISISNIIENLTIGLSNPSELYYGKFGTNPAAFGISASLWVLLAPITYSAIPLFLYNYTKFNLVFKFLGIVSILLEATRWISIGTNHGLISIAFIFLSDFIVKSLRHNIESKSSTLFSISFKKIAARVIIASIILFGVYYFILSISNRITSVANFTTGGISPNLDNWLVKYTPSFIGIGVILITNYLTQGYYALSLALPLKNNTMFGIGNSLFLISNFSELLNKDFFLQTYQVKISRYGWRSLQYYHTFFMWVANDVGFIGALFSVFVLSFYLGYILKKAILEENKIALVLLPLLLTIFFYMPSNNVVLSTSNTFMAFWVLTLIMIGTEFLPKIKLN